MPRRKIFLHLLKKFKWPLFFLLLLTFLVSYLSFLIRFNLRTNLLYWKYRGQFYYLFGKYPVIEKIDESKIFVDWPKLLLILFLLYFPIKIVVQFTLHYFKNCYERKLKVHLTKKCLDFAYKNPTLIASRSSEKVYLLNQIVPEFSRQFFNFPLTFLDIGVDLGLGIFSLIFLIRTSNLSELIPLIMVFLLVNLIWLVLFYFFFRKTCHQSTQKKLVYEKEEQTQIRLFLENLDFADKPTNLNKIHNLLDKNSEKISHSLFVSVFTELPNFIIPGITILFLFLYYHFWLGGMGGLGWNEYFVASNLQRLLSEGKKLFYWLTQIPNFRKNYRKIEKFFD